MKRLAATLPLLSAALLLVACASVKVERTDEGEAIDLSGYWNDTDSRLVSEEMVGDCLSSPWSNRAAAKFGREPSVIVGAVRNRSSEHLNTQTFVKDLERAYLNSGRVRLAASSEQRGEIRSERDDQSRYSSIETAKSHGLEKAADFTLQGQINTILDSAGKQQVRYYQVELELIDIESNEKVWIGQKKLKKVVTRRRVGF